MYHKTIPQTNVGSMADIAFLLLIFFLVTTTLEQDEGIQSLLPPASINNSPTPVPDRDVLEIGINGADQIQIEGKNAELSSLRSAVIKFYTNPQHSSDYPERHKITLQLCETMLSKPSIEKLEWKARKAVVNQIGAFEELPAKAVISIKLDRSTSYSTYISVQNELSAGINHLRDSCSLSNFGVRYNALKASIPNDRDKIRAIRLLFPKRISEPEPVDY